MRKLILFLLVFITVNASAQWTIINGKQRFAQGLGIPVKDTGATNLNDSAQIVLRPQDSAIYYKYKGKWQKATGGAVTTPNLQQVTDAGATTTQDVKVNTISVYNPYSLEYDAKMSGNNDGGVSFIDKNGDTAFAFSSPSAQAYFKYGITGQPQAKFIVPNASTELTLPNISGTIALISNITYPDTNTIATQYYVDSSTKTKIDSLKRSTDSVFARKNGSWIYQYNGFVPYTGATGDVDLGTNKLSAQSVNITGTNGNGHLHLKHQATDPTATGSSTALFANVNGDLEWKNASNYYTTLKTQQNADRVYSFQNKTYTIGDSADIATKLNASDTTSLSTRINAKQNQLNGTGFVKASGTTISYDNTTYLSEDPIILAQQAMGSTIKGVCVACRSFREMLSQATLSTGTIYITAYYLSNPTTITGVKYYQQTQGNFTANNENRFGLYTYSGGVLTLVASSANNTNLWKGTAGTVVSEPFSSTYSAAAGLYFIVGIYNASGTPPTNPAIGACSAKIGSNVANGDFTNSARFTATGSATTLPSSITMSTTTATTLNLAFFLY